MLNLLKNEWRKIFLAFSVTLLLSVLAVVVTTMLVYKTYDLEQQLEVYEVGFSIFNMLWSLIAVIPTAWLMYFERKTNFIKYTLPRVEKRTYIFVKAIVSMMTGYLIVFGISIVSIIVALYIVPPIAQQLALVNPKTGELMGIFPEARIFGEVFMNQPFLYGFILSVWKGMIGSFMALFGFVLSLYSRNLFVILTGPFIYMILDNFFWYVLKLSSYRLIVAFEPTTVSVERLSWQSFVVGPIVLLLVIASYGFYMRFVVKKSVYEQ